MLLPIYEPQSRANYAQLCATRFRNTLRQPARLPRLYCCQAHKSVFVRIIIPVNLPFGVFRKSRVYMSVEQLVPVTCDLSGRQPLLADLYVPKLLCNESSGISRCEKEVKGVLRLAGTMGQYAKKRDCLGAKFPILKVFDNISTEGG